MLDLHYIYLHAGLFLRLVFCLLLLCFAASDLALELELGLYLYGITGHILTNTSVTNVLL